MLLTSILAYMLARYSDNTEATKGTLNLRASAAAFGALIMAILAGVQGALFVWQVLA
jgi:hypothetical protein